MPESRTRVETEPPPEPLHRHTDWSVNETAADALSRIGAPSVSALTEALRAPDARRRIRAARILARIGPDAAKAVPYLIEALSDEDMMVRRSAARALGQIGPDAAAAVPALMQLLEDGQIQSTPSEDDQPEFN